MTHVRAIRLEDISFMFYRGGCAGIWISGQQEGNFTLLEVKDDEPGMKEKTGQRYFKNLPLCIPKGSGVGFYLIRRVANNAGESRGGK